MRHALLAVLMAAVVGCDPIGSDPEPSNPFEDCMALCVSPQRSEGWCKDASPEAGGCKGVPTQDAPPDDN